MKKVFVVLALIGLMQLMEFLQAENFGMIEIFTLTASGFVILAAYTLADIGSSLLKLPRVTGYILAGILVGPYVTDILSKEVVKELTMINTLALGLIALNAGLELSIEGVRKIAKTLSATIGLKLLFLPLIVGGTLYGLGTFYPQLIDPSLSQDSLIALAWLFAAFAIGTSPAIVIAVSAEMKTKGRLTDLVLGAAIFKDLVVVICLALVIAFCAPLLDPAQSFSISSLTAVGYEILMAVILGALVGGIITLYIRYVNYQMLLFIFCLILIAAEISHALHAELLLVFITGGFVVRNFTPFEHQLHKPLELVALPTFVIFFTIAGAGINLPRTLQFLPVALILFAARALAFFLASRLGGRSGDEPAEVKAKAWLGYLPQAGVTLGLIGIAANKLEPIGPLIMDLGIAVVALNLLVGPLGLRFALAGEASEQEAATGDSRDSSQGRTLSPAQLEAGKNVAIDVDDPELAGRIGEFVNEVKTGYRFHILQPVEQWHRQLTQSFAEHYVQDGGEQAFKSAKAVSQWLAINRDATAFDSKFALMDFWRHTESKLEYIPESFTSSIHTRYLRDERPKGVSASALLAKVRNWWLRLKVRLRGDKALSRNLPLASIFQAHSEHQLYQQLLDTQQTLMASERRSYLVLYRFCCGEFDAKTTEEQLTTILEKTSQDLSADFDHRCELLARNLAQEVNRCGTPQQPVPSLSIADVAQQNEAKKQLLDQAFHWDQDFSDVMKDELQCASSKRNAFIKCDYLIKDLDKTIEDLFERTKTDLNAFKAKLEDTKVALAAEDLSADAMEHIRMDILDQVQQINKEQITHTAHRFAVDYSSHKLGVQVKKIAAAAPYELKVLRQHPEKVTVLEPMEVRTFEPARTMQDFFAGEWVAEIDDAITDFRDHFTAFTDLVEAFHSQFSAATEGKDDQEVVSDLRSLLLTGISTAQLGIREYLTVLGDAAEEAKTTIDRTYADARDKVEKEQRQQSLRKAALGQIEAMQSRIERLLGRYQGNTVIDALILVYRWYKRNLSRFRATEWESIPERISRWLSPEVRTSHLHDTVRQLDVSDVLGRVTPLVRRGFSLQPLRDPKFFIANSEELARASRLIKTANVADRGTSILITGLPGSGKSSLLNALQMRARTENVVTLDHQQALRRGGVFAALARQLDCSPTVGDIRSTLAEERSTILIDNIEFWFHPTLAGLDNLRRLLELIIASSSRTHWILTSSAFYQNSYGDTSGLRQAIQHHIPLKPVSTPVLKKVIGARLNYCGLKTNYQELFIRNFSERLRFKDREDIFYSTLARKAHGNIHHALSLFLRAVKMGEDKVIRPRLRPINLKHELDLDTIPTEVLAVLLTLHRHGPLRQKALIEALPQPQTVTINALRYLNNRQLIELFGRRQKAYRIKPTFHPLFGYFAQRRY